MGHTSGFITDNSLSDIIANARKKYGRNRVHHTIYKELLYGGIQPLCIPMSSN
jgi:hypothetical protein